MGDQGADQSSTNSSTTTGSTYSFPCRESTHNNVSTLSLDNIQGQTQDDQSLMNDIFQYLSEVPLQHPMATRSLPDYSNLDPPIIHHNESLFGLGTTIPTNTFDAQGYKYQEQDSKNVNVSKMHDPKGKLPLKPEGLDIPHPQYLHVSLKGLEIKDIDISKGQSQGKQQPRPVRKLQQDFIRKRSQKRSSELRRRCRINDKINTIQSLIPNCEKGNHASILDQGINYIKYLKHQLNVLSSVGGQSQMQAQSSSASAQMIPGMYNIIHWPSQMVTHPGYPYMLRTSVGFAAPQLSFQNYISPPQQNPAIFAMPQQQLPVPQYIPPRSPDQPPCTKPYFTS